MRVTLVAVPALLFAAVSAPALAAEITVKSVADAFICSGDLANDNHGAPSFGYSLRAVGQQNAFTGNQIGRQLYQFELPSGLDAADILSATLKLMTFDNYAGYPADTAVYGLTDSWAETTVTWNTQPATDSGELDNVSAGCCGLDYDYDVTAYVQSQVSGGDTTISFQQRGQDESVVGGVRWIQREGDGMSISSYTGVAPRLVITTVPEPTAIGPLLVGLVGAVGRLRFRAA